jgi:hypothetical protein
MSGTFDKPKQKNRPSVIFIVRILPLLILEKSGLLVS